RDGLVADDELRRNRERASDADALALAARELVRIASHVIGIEAHRLEEPRHAIAELRRRLRELVHDERLADDRAHGHSRVQRCERVLEDDLHVAAQALKLAAIERGDVLALEPDLSRGRLDEPQDAASRRGLAATRFPNEAERLARREVEAHAIDRMDA